MAARVGHVRWTICALLFLATTINYIDRQVLGILAPILQREIGWSEVEYGYIVTAFQAAYALGLLGLADQALAALEEALLRDEDEAEITSQLDRVYGDQSSTLDGILASLPGRLLDKETW